MASFLVLLEQQLLLLLLKEETSMSLLGLGRSGASGAIATAALLKQREKATAVGALFSFPQVQAIALGLYCQTHEQLSVKGHHRCSPLAARR